MNIEKSLINKIILSHLIEYAASNDYSSMASLIAYLCETKNQDDDIWSSIVQIKSTRFYWHLAFVQISFSLDTEHSFLIERMRNIKAIDFQTITIQETAMIHDLSEDNNTPIDSSSFRKILAINLEKEKLNHEISSVALSAVINKV